MNYRDILRKYWGHDDFRGIQREIIESIASGHDTLGLMPTGGGKSVTFQVPALAQDGVCIVITPLISLMKDQVDRLRSLGIPAYALNSGLTHAEIVQVLDNCVFGDIKFLYVAPERLASPLFQRRLRAMRVSFITVDEAHCISQWGYDFRPAYLRIAALRRLLPGKPVLALTATATPAVADDIQRQLAFREANVFRMSFRRKNISYVVRETSDITSEAEKILRAVPGTAIIYTSSRRRTRDIARELTAVGISADFYHAGLDTYVKAKRQHDWQRGDTRVIVATNAFGMGIDKPDVRVVIHADVPTSLEAYFQEAGRAGRDGLPAYAVLLTSQSTPKVLRQRLAQTFPEPEYIADVYEHLAYFYEIGVGMGAGHTFVLPFDKFCNQNLYSPFLADAALQILSNAGYILYAKDPDTYSRVTFCLSRDDLYKIHDLPADEDRLIQEMLRLYTGMFTDYVNIDEHAIAQKTDTTRERVYTQLTNLRRRGIIKYVPPRTEPLLTYIIDRVDGRDIKLHDSVYADRRRVLAEHIEAMLAYITDDDVCRQTQLVRYFGEEGHADCGTCDVCRARRTGRHTALPHPAPPSATDCATALTRLLADHRPHRLADIMALPYPADDLSRLIDNLVESGEATTDTMTITAKTTSRPCSTQCQ